MCLHPPGKKINKKSAVNPPAGSFRRRKHSGRRSQRPTVGGITEMGKLLFASRCRLLQPQAVTSARFTPWDVFHAQLSHLSPFVKIPSLNGNLQRCPQGRHTRLIIGFVNLDKLVHFWLHFSRVPWRQIVCIQSILNVLKCMQIVFVSYGRYGESVFCRLHMRYVMKTQ